MTLEAATESFGQAARKLNWDWGTQFDGKQIQRWSEGIGAHVAGLRDAEVRACEQGRRPRGPANDPVLLVIEMDGGRVQSRDKNPETGSRWKEDKVLAISTYLPGQAGNGGHAGVGDAGEAKPQRLSTTYVATMRDSEAFGAMARTEAERRGIRQATQTILINDGGGWIGTQHQEQFFRCPMIIDWHHAVEHLYDVGRAECPHDPRLREELVAPLKQWLWDGQFDRLLDRLRALSQQAGPPTQEDGADHPRRVLACNVGYFERHRRQMDYPAYRARGWPIGSGVVEAAVKQFNQRVKGTDRFWTTAGSEAILALRALWLSEDDRWDHYWLYGRLERKAA